jgi:hypothetical protein
MGALPLMTSQRRRTAATGLAGKHGSGPQITKGAAREACVRYRTEHRLSGGVRFRNGPMTSASEAYGYAPARG